MLTNTAAPFALSATDYALPDYCALEAVPETGSTNADLLARARAGNLPAAQSGRVAVRIAHAQSAGRGRMGRAWVAQSGASLLMSVAGLRTESPQQLGGVTVALGLAAVQALRQHSVPAQLKWPNDVLLNGAKLAGILVESAAAPAGLALVAGIGVNGVISANERAQLGQPVAALADAIDLNPARAAQIGRDVACAFADVLRAPTLDAVLHDLPARFAVLDAYRNQNVTLLADGNLLGQGKAVGIDAQGHLLVQEATGLRAYAHGEVSLRPA